jgi:hypothetical protein
MLKTCQKGMGESKGDAAHFMGDGWIDENNLAKYTVSGRNNYLSVIDTDTRVKHLLRLCWDFEEEESLLQSQGGHLGITVDWMPKCHYELAVEGIDFSWGCAKSIYWQQRVSEKRKKKRTVKKQWGHAYLKMF